MKIKTFDVLKEYILEYLKAQFSYVKLIWLEKTVHAISYIITSVIMFYIMAFVLFFLAFLFSFWYIEKFDNNYEGFLLSSAFFLLMAIVFFLLRKVIFSNTLVKLFNSLFYMNTENEHSSKEYKEF